MDRHRMSIYKFVIEILPHDGLWHPWKFIKRQKNKTFVFETHYQEINAGFTKVILKIPNSALYDMKIILTGQKKFTKDTDKYWEGIYDSIIGNYPASSVHDFDKQILLEDI